MNDLEIDEQLHEYAGAWRAAQPPPSSGLPLSPNGSRPSRWLPLAAAAAVIAIVAAVAGVVTGGRSGHAPASSGSAPACRVSRLRVLVMDSAVRVTNVGHAGCTLSGAPGVAFRFGSADLRGVPAHAILGPGATYVQPWRVTAAATCPLPWFGPATKPMTISVAGNPVSVQLPANVADTLQCLVLKAEKPRVAQGAPQPCVATDLQPDPGTAPVPGNTIVLRKATPGTCVIGPAPAGVALGTTGGQISMPLSTINDSSPSPEPTTQELLSENQVVSVDLVDHSAPACTNRVHPTTWTTFFVGLPSNSVVSIPLGRPIPGYESCPVSNLSYQLGWRR